LTITEERKKRVIDLYYNQGKTTREIAKIERMSIRDISPTLREEESRRQRNKDQQQQEELSSKAYELFSKGKKPVEVAITLNLREPEATKLFIEYCRLKRLHILNSIYKETNGKLGLFLKLYRLMKEKGMSIEQVANALDIAIHKLPYMESLYKQLKDEVDKLQYTIQVLLKDIDALKYKLSILDRTAFACEQNCKRTEQRVQDLTDKKDRLEKWIATISNNDDLKQIVKENVKTALSENKQVISAAFTALLQTLKANPKMVKSIYAISLTNVNDRRHNDNDDNDNAIKCLESNKDNILDLTEKHYENIVEALTKDAIDIATSASSLNSTLSLPHSSSSAFSNSFDQIDIFRKEESESSHNRKGGIAD
jgi:hypothetical protein